ncbi:transposase [Streptomyces sp. TRM66268-LWL]|uniref:Transposase n=1 Tax=Streptomyces polyasparticus TaxID=2767826 RepID=A0ABR7SXK4_9ACTN|nr:transposase [Streptomyces polyasparticus]
MIGTITERDAVQEPVVVSAAEAVSDEQLVAMLVDCARSEGLQLTGEGGLLQQLTKRFLESALDETEGGGGGHPT